MDQSDTPAPSAGRQTVWAWLGANRWAVMAGALTAVTTTFGLIASAGTVVPLVLGAVGLPRCLTYADVYNKPGSYFKKEGDVWREHFPDGTQYVFKEVRRTPDIIDLLNLTPRPSERDWQTLIVRLPVCGGSAKIILGVPERQLDLAEVWRG
jgi:hypothetical protein